MCDYHFSLEYRGNAGQDFPLLYFLICKQPKHTHTVEHLKYAGNVLLTSGRHEHLLP